MPRGKPKAKKSLLEQLVKKYAPKLGTVLPYDIRVTNTLNRGIIVKIGCAVLSFSNGAEAGDFLKDFLTYPGELQDMYYADSNLKMAEVEPPAVPQQQGGI